MGTLSKPDILKHIELGNIVIDPFDQKNLNNASYDVRLGNYFHRQHRMDHTQTINPYHENSIKKMYSKAKKAIPVKQIRSKTNPFYGFDDNDLVILIDPHETILAHTIEFIGGKNGIPKKCGAVAAVMRSRSSVGRIGIAVCKCAGWGDIGYINRWTMEITNFSNGIIPLPVGMRIAQIIFKEVTPIDETDFYHKKGKYQRSVDIKRLKNSWKPEDMLPQLDKDRDLGHFQDFYKYL